jgi:hypothetical protein
LVRIDSILAIFSTCLDFAYFNLYLSASSALICFFDKSMNPFFASTLITLRTSSFPISNNLFIVIFFLETSSLKSKPSF